jgi:SAM-dependent methyltransferase
MRLDLKQLRSWRHGFWFFLSERIGWSRGIHQERPARKLTRATAAQAPRITELHSRYGVAFEESLGESSAIKNYEYLDLLDRGFQHWGRGRPEGGVVCDAGSASFWYASALHAFFRPEQLIGVEIEGHRLFRNGHSRIDYAQGYVSRLPRTRFEIADYSKVVLQADVITAWFPFLTATSILAWRLPLSLLAPDRFFAQVRRNLKPGGLFFMVNHGPSEAELAFQRCRAAGLENTGQWQDPGPLSDYRLSPPVLSWWCQD